MHNHWAIGWMSSPFVTQIGRKEEDCSVPPVTGIASFEQMIGFHFGGDFFDRSYWFAWNTHISMNYTFSSSISDHVEVQSASIVIICSYALSHCIILFMNLLVRRASLCWEHCVVTPILFTKHPLRKDFLPDSYRIGANLPDPIENSSQWADPCYSPFCTVIVLQIQIWYSCSTIW